MTSKTRWQKHIEKIFAEVPVEELQEFFKFELTSNAKWRSRFLDRFSHIWDLHTDQKYRRTVEEAINRNKLKGQFVSKGKSYGLAAELRTLLQLADMQCTGGNWRDGFDVLSAILDVVVSKGWEMDDSSGAIGDCMHKALAQLRKLFDDCPVGEMKDQVLHFAYLLAIDPIYEPWDIDYAMFDFLLDQSWSTDYLEPLMKMCRDRVSKEKDPVKEGILALQLVKVLREADESEELQETLTKYGHFSEVLMFRLDLALEKKNYASAIEIGQQGLNLAMTEHDYGSVLDWQRKLLEIAIDQGDLNDRKKYTYQIYLSERSHDPEIFEALKSLHGEHWPTIRERLTQELKGENPDNVVKLAEIYTSENLPTDLLHLLEENPRLVNHYGAKIHGKFPAEILEVYRLHLEDFLSNYVGRNHYRRFCRELNRIAGLVPGGRDFAVGMIIRMRQEYRLRTALVQELDKLGAKFGID